MPAVLAIDLGTSAVKVALVDDRARVLASASAPLETRFLPGGGAEQDADEWWEAIGACARSVLAQRPADVAAVVVTSQYMSIVAIDGAGRPLAPVVMWMDQRGQRHVRPPAGEGDLALWLERHGFFPAFGDPAHIAYLRAERPEVHDAAAAFVEPVDALNARLSGRICATQTTAMPLMTVDNRQHDPGGHDDELVGRIDVAAEKLPPLIRHDDVVGPLTPEAAAHLGLSTDVVVLPGTIDSITSGVGCGVVDSTKAALIVGTTTVVVTAVDHKTADYAHQLVAMPSPLPGRWFVLAENGVGGRALEVGLRLLDLDFGAAEQLAATAPPGANGVRYEPWLTGSIAPVAEPGMRGGFSGLGIDTARADMVRALYEGVAANAAWLLPHVAALAGTSWDSIRLSGGGATSPFWAQVIADTLGVTVERVVDPRHGNSRGAAIVAYLHPYLHRLTPDAIADLELVEHVHRPSPQVGDVSAQVVSDLAAWHEATRPFYASRRDRP